MLDSNFLLAISNLAVEPAPDLEQKPLSLATGYCCTETELFTNGHASRTVPLITATVPISNRHLCMFPLDTVVLSLAVQYFTYCLSRTVAFSNIFRLCLPCLMIEVTKVEYEFFWWRQELWTANSARKSKHDTYEPYVPTLLWFRLNSIYPCYILLLIIQLRPCWF